MNTINKFINETIKFELKEDPDSAHGSNWQDYDAHPFGYLGEELEIGEPGTTHGDISEDRWVLGYPGRIWTISKIISFWDYPKTSKKFGEIVDDLERGMGIKIWDNGYVVEVPNWETSKNSKLTPVDIENIPDYTPSSFDYNDDWDGELVPIEDYAGNYRNPKSVDHVISPMLKGNKAKPPYDKYDKLKMEPAKWKYHKDKNLAEEIIKDEINKFFTKKP